MRRGRAVVQWCAGLLAAALLLAGCGSQARERWELVPEREVVWADWLGVNAHLLWFDPPAYQQQLDRWQALGLRWVRIDLHWDTIEPLPGQWRWDVLDPMMAQLQQRGIQAEVYLVGSAPHASTAPAGSPHPDQYPPRDAGVYAQALVTLARRYGQVAAWQVWNEPNLPAFWRPREDVAGYGHLLQTSYRALKEQAPGRQVVLGGMGYYSQMPSRGGELMLPALAAGGLYDMDIITAYHPYSLHPEGDDPKAMDFVARARQGNAALRAAGAGQIWADEWGWSSYAGPVEEQPLIGEQGQADYLLRRLALMAALDYDKTFVFALSDLDGRASVRDRSYGLLDLKGEPKPAYLALQRLLALTGPRLLPGQAPVLEQVPDGLVGIGWRRPDGGRLWMFWASQPAALRLPAIRTAVLHDPLGGTQQALQARDGALQLEVGTQLQVLQW